VLPLFDDDDGVELPLPESVDERLRKVADTERVGRCDDARGDSAGTI
jgi:hypothetical protein